MMEIAADFFAESLSKLHLQITIEIAELEKSYFKIAGKTETEE